MMNAQPLVIDFNTRLRHTLKQIEKAIGIDRGQFVAILDLSTTRYTEILNGKEKLSADEFVRLCQSFDINPKLVSSGGVDYVTLAERFHTRRTAIPRRYAQPSEKLSRALGIQIILKFLSNRPSPSYSNRILSRLQLQPEAFKNPNDFIHPNIYHDLLTELRMEGFSDLTFLKMGQATFSPENTGIKAILSKSKTPKALYTSVHEELFPQLYDRVFDYQLLNITSTGCSGTISLTEEVKDIFHTNTFGNRELCLYKAGVYTSFLAHTLPYFAKVTETSCMYKGDPRCILHFSWN